MFKDSFYKSSYKPKSFLSDFNKGKNEEKKTSFTLPAYVKPTGSAGTPSFNKTESAASSTVGSEIKSKLRATLSKKYGELDTKNLFDDIDDKDVENNIGIAESAIKTNIDKGFLSKDYFKKFPNLRDGLALSYAAADKGNSKEAKRAREAAYTEDEPLVKGTDENLLYQNLSNSDLPGITKAVKKGAEPPKMTTLIGDPNKKADISLLSNRSEENMPVKGVRFKAKMDEANNQDKSTPKFEDVKSYAPKNSITAELQKREKEKKNHKIYAAPNYPTSYYGSMDATNDLTSGEYSRNSLLKLSGISEKDLSNSEDKHINNWKNLAKLTSTKELQSVTLDMIDHFIEGTGADYSNAVLTKKVKDHPATKRYMSDFTKVFEAQLQSHNGDVSAFADNDDFHAALRKNGVLLSTYDYSGINDLFGGLEFAVHGWTESQVDVFSLNVEPDGSYSGTLRFTFKDNFGLNDPDVEKYGKYHDGFKSWFILQHYDEYSEKYKPFKTVVEIDYPISGKIEGYRK